METTQPKKQINWAMENLKGILFLFLMAVWAIAIAWLCFSIANKTINILEYTPVARDVFSVTLFIILAMQLGLTISFLITVNERKKTIDEQN